MHPFERELSICEQDIELILRGHAAIPWADYLLNPRRLRGSDFLMRWSQGQWSEELLNQAVNASENYFALAYGPSGTAPSHDVREFELYFERLEAAGLGRLKRPDLLVFRKSDAESVEHLIVDLGSIGELPFVSESHPAMQRLLTLAVLAIECENSLWVGKRMPHYNAPLKNQKRLGGQQGLSKTAVLPTVIIKQEDREFLLNWQHLRGVPIHIWHAFYDVAFGLSLDDAERLIHEGKILATEQTFQAPGGATTKKAIYKFYHHYAYALGEIEGDIALAADKIEDKNGHILPFVRFRGGTLNLASDAIEQLDAAVSKGHPMPSPDDIVSAEGAASTDATSDAESGEE